MTVRAEFLFEALTRWNYFPNQKCSGGELPPIFSTRRFTPEVAATLLGQTPRKIGYDQVEYYATRYNNVPRPLSIPHPMGYAHLVGAICDNWNELAYICDNDHSLIKPEEHHDGRALLMDYEAPLEHTSRVLRMGFGKRFRVHTDISNCFPSIYTHAIPWATVGLAHAKANRSSSLWFNKLDQCQRAIKRNETQGVAIGPGTSNIIAEAILARIDQELSAKYEHFRFIDDYTCYAKTFEEGQDFLRELGDALRAYKLTLNLRKTEIVELPTPLNPSWIVEVTGRMPAGTPNEPPKLGKYYRASEVVRFIDFAVELSKGWPDGSVLKFAVKSVIQDLGEEAIQPVLEYLLNLARFYPVLLPLLHHLLSNSSIDCLQYATNLNDIAAENAVNRRSDGMCWSLYFLIENELEIEPDVAEKILGSRDCMAILLLHAVGAYESEVSKFIAELDEKDPYEMDRYWVLLYQRFVAGLAPNPYSGERCFEVMKDWNVDFLPQSDSLSPSEIKLVADQLGFVDVTGELDKET